MQILGLLGMYFDAVVVEVEKYLLFFQVGSGHVYCDSCVDSLQGDRFRKTS